MLQLFPDPEAPQTPAIAQEEEQRPAIKAKKAKPTKPPKEPKPPKPLKPPKPPKPRLPLTVLEEAWKERFSKEIPAMPAPEFLTYGANGGVCDFSYLHELVPTRLEFIVSDPNEQIEVLFELELQAITWAEDTFFWARYDVHATLADTQCKGVAAFYVRLGYPKVSTDIRRMGNASLIHAQVLYSNALRRKGLGCGDRDVSDLLANEVVKLFWLSVKDAPIHRAVQEGATGWTVEFVGLKIRIKWRWFSPYGFAFFSAQLADSEFKSPVFYYAVDLGACMKNLPPRCYTYLWRMSQHFRLAWPEKPRINPAFYSPDEHTAIISSNDDAEMIDVEIAPEVEAPPGKQEAPAQDTPVAEGGLTKAFLRHYQELCQRVSEKVLGVELTGDNCLDAAEAANTLFKSTVALWVLSVALPQMWGVTTVEEFTTIPPQVALDRRPPSTVVEFNDDEVNTALDTPADTPDDELKRRYLEQLFGFKRKKKS